MHWNRLKAGGAVVYEATVLQSMLYLNTTSNSNPWRGEETETNVTHPVQYRGGGGGGEDWILVVLRVGQLDELCKEFSKTR